MENVLDETLYQDGFLTRTLNSSTLYEKSNLNLTFVGNNNVHPTKHPPPQTVPQSKNTTTPGSPDLDFLKFGSPDLEQMFLSIDVNEDTNISDENNGNLAATNSAAFNIEEDLVSAENCFTEALQHLHDKNDRLPVDLLDITFKPEIDNEVHINLNHTKECKSLLRQPNDLIKRTASATQNNNHQIKQHAVNLTAMRQQMYNNDTLNNNQQINNKTLLHHPERTTMVQPHHHQHNIPPGISPDVVLPEQIAINNQIALINTMNQSVNVHQLHQQQQEIAFLTQAMGFQADRENLQPHMNMNGGYPQHINQMPPHIQQKLIEQQIIHQQINGGYPPTGDNNLQLANMSQIDTLGIDDHTLKMFVENPHLAPINLDIQELIKRERKKLRNRIASSKCRKRKLEREGRLEDKVKTLKEKNIELNAVANALKQQICDLKQRVMDHVGEGCQIVLPS